MTPAQYEGQAANMKGRSFQEQMSYSRGAVPLGTDESLSKGSSFQEQKSYKHDRLFPTGTDELLMKGCSFLEQTRYFCWGVPFRSR